MRRVTDCGSWLDGSGNVGGGVVAGAGSGVGEEITIDLLQDAPIRFPCLERFPGVYPPSTLLCCVSWNRTESVTDGQECFFLRVLYFGADDPSSSLERGSDPYRPGAEYLASGGGSLPAVPSSLRSRPAVGDNGVRWRWRSIVGEDWPRWRTEAFLDAVFGMVSGRGYESSSASV